MLALELGAAGGPFLLGRFKLSLLFGIFQIIPPIQILWQSPRSCEWNFIKHVWSNLIEAFLGLFFLVTVLIKNILHIYCVPMVLIGKKHLNKGKGSYRFYFTPLNNLYVMRRNLIKGWSIYLSLWWVLSEPPQGSWVPLTWLSQLLVHNTGIHRQFYGGIYD